MATILENGKIAFLGDMGRRCRSCQRTLYENFEVFWDQSARDWRQWKLTIRCRSCQKTFGPVAKSNMPEDESLIPPKPDIAGQKELFSDAGASEYGNRDH